MQSLMTVAQGAALVGLAAACSGIGNAQPLAADLHGAAPAKDQLARTDALALTPDPLAVPRGVDPVFWTSTSPKDNTPTPARIALGKKLYFDTRLSKDKTVACATCHDATRSFTDLRPRAEGIGGQVGRRNSPTTMNASLLPSQFWDGRAATVDEQALLPILNPIEMGHPDAATAVAAIADDPEYQKLFQEAYGRAPGYVDIGRAIGAFERTLVFLDAPFDAWLAGDPAALSADAKLGWVLFNGKARCVTCHPFNGSNPLGTDGRFHNIGVSARAQDFEALSKKALDLLAKDGSEAAIDAIALGGDTSELGRFVVSRIESDIGAFRTPQLRNVSVTGPYMHDGSLHTLWDVMDHYNKGGEANPRLDGGIEALALSDVEIDQVVAFLFALTDRRLAAENQAALDAQRAQAAKQRPFKNDDLALRRKLTWEK